MTEVKLVTDENDILFALMPDGTYRELLVEWHGRRPGKNVPKLEGLEAWQK